MRALQPRHDATTLSQEWVPPRERGTTWSRFSALLPQYWQRWWSRANTARRESGAVGAERHPHEVHEPDHRRDRDGAALGTELGAVAVDDLGLVLEHEHDRAAGRHDTQRFEAGVQQERPSHGGPHLHCPAHTFQHWPIGPGGVGPAPFGGRSLTVRGPDLDGFARRHHSRYSTTSAARGRAAGAVRGLHPEREVRPRRHREVRRPPPPPRGHEPRPLAHRRPPQVRPHEHRADGAEPNGATRRRTGVGRAIGHGPGVRNHGHGR